VAQQKQGKISAKALVGQRKSELLLAKQNLARSKSLYVSKDISLKELQENETAVATAEATLAASEADLLKSDASIETAIAKTDSIKVNLNECELLAPLDGRVLYRSREPGEVVNAESSILTVLDLTDVYMQFYLRTEQAGLVAVGAEARIVLGRHADRPIPAKVTFVESRSQFTPKQVETQSERDKLMFRIKVNVDPDILKRYADQVKTGLPGMAYVRLDNNAPGPPLLPCRPMTAPSQ
jgi:HlyD family secretion protein